MFQVVELGGVQTLVSLAKSDKLVIQVIHGTRIDSLTGLEMII